MKRGKKLEFSCTLVVEILIILPAYIHLLCVAGLGFADLFLSLNLRSRKHRFRITSRKSRSPRRSTARPSLQPYIQDPGYADLG